MGFTKKRINELLGVGIVHGNVMKIAENMYLKRDYVEYEDGTLYCDNLTLNASILYSGDYSIEIRSRDYDGIKKEVADAVEKIYANAGEIFAKRIRNGYCIR